MLFLSYMHCINNTITCQIKLFADDSVLHRSIYNGNDQVIFRNDLDTISSWAENCLLQIIFINVLSSLLRSNVFQVSMTIIYVAQRLGRLQAMIIILV